MIFFSLSHSSLGYLVVYLIIGECLFAVLSSEVIKAFLLLIFVYNI